MTPKINIITAIGTTTQIIVFLLGIANYFILSGIIIKKTGYTIGTITIVTLGLTGIITAGLHQTIMMKTTQEAIKRR